MVCCFVYNFKVFKFQISHWSDFNRKFSICWNRTGHWFQRVEIGSVANFGDGNRKSKWAFTLSLSLSLSLTSEEGVPTLASIKHARTLSFSLTLTGEEGVRTLASIKQTRTLSIPHSVSQSACVCCNRATHIRHQCRKTTVLSCHRCLINTGVEKLTTLNYKFELWPTDVSKQE